MPPLSPGALLWACEMGAGQHPLDRALTLLLAADPAASRRELAALPLPERDRRLLRLRAATLGPELPAFTPCPGCGERLEFSLDTHAVLDGPPAPPAAEAAVDGVRVAFRHPDSRDLADAAGCGGVDGARRLLVERCVVAAEGPAGPLAPGALPGPVLAAVGEALSAACAAEVRVSLECPACGAEWSALLDVPDFFWTELLTRARRLLREVDVLARTYHWSEAEILALTPWRRGAYLEMAEA